MFPSFYVWLEMGAEGDGSPLNKSQPMDMGNDNSEDDSGVSEPQHKKGESSLTLNKLVEKRIKEMMEELVSKGKADENSIVDAIKYFLSKNFPQQDQSQDQNQDQDQNQQQPMMPDQAQLAQPNQTQQLPSPQSPPSQPFTS